MGEPAICATRPPRACASVTAQLIAPGVLQRCQRRSRPANSTISNAKASVDRQFKLHNEVRLIPAILLSLDVKLDLTYSPLDLSHQMFNVGFKSEQKSRATHLALDHPRQRTTLQPAVARKTRPWSRPDECAKLVDVHKPPAWRRVASKACPWPCARVVEHDLAWALPTAPWSVLCTKP